MTKSRFGGLSGVMRGQAEPPRAQAREPMMPEDEPEEMPDHEDEEEAGDGKKKDPTMTDPQKKPAAQVEQPAAPEANAEQEQPTQPGTDDAVATAVAAERKRVADVFASEHVAGREQAAAALLADSDMSAEKIVATLPKLSPTASADDGKSMLEQMREGTDADLGTGGDDLQPEAKDNHGWGKAHAKVARLHGRTPTTK